jgi:hypothetical protein
MLVVHTFWSKLNFHYDKGTWAMAHGFSGGLIQKVGYHEILWAIIHLIRLVQTTPKFLAVPKTLIDTFTFLNEAS